MKHMDKPQVTAKIKSHFPDVHKDVMKVGLRWLDKIVTEQDMEGILKPYQITELPSTWKEVKKMTMESAKDMLPESVTRGTLPYLLNHSVYSPAVKAFYVIRLIVSMTEWYHYRKLQFHNGRHDIDPGPSAADIERELFGVAFVLLKTGNSDWQLGYKTRQDRNTIFSFPATDEILIPDSCRGWFFHSRPDTHPLRAFPLGPPQTILVSQSAIPVNFPSSIPAHLTRAQYLVEMNKPFVYNRNVWDEFRGIVAGMAWPEPHLAPLMPPANF
ncbi:hypothetical protein F5Y17DRAFT_420927 [Xylariaceae sp. FL0594]|nr:hypothetical protein F5Y17DRAFT_420927 [Xylariaceae sp. FL0594]